MSESHTTGEDEQLKPKGRLRRVAAAIGKFMTEDMSPDARNEADGKNSLRLLREHTESLPNAVGQLARSIAILAAERDKKAAERKVTIGEHSYNPSGIHGALTMVGIWSDGGTKSSYAK